MPQPPADLARHVPAASTPPAGAAGSGSAVPGLLLSCAAAAVVLGVQQVLPGLSPLLLAILLGAVLSNVAGVRGSFADRIAPGIQVASRRLLRLGVVLLGLQLALTDIAGLGWPVLVGVIVVVAGGIGATMLAGRLLGVSRTQTLLIACGFSICGAAAVAGADGVLRRRNSDETATAVALVVVFGTVMIGVLPAAATLLGLDATTAGIWAGASIHEVAQVVAAAGIVGGSALKVAVVVKLARVLLLAPVLAVISFGQRESSGGVRGGQPVVPLFVAGFVAAVGLRSLGVLPAPVLQLAGLLQTGLLAAAMFALGTSLHASVLRRAGLKPILLGLIATVVVALLGLATCVLA
ncbi:MAG: putative sulfate exporter family transporter [Micropruina sp.]|uniref:YeiH family protein n=1 Tax=Micropruina sp. TaxID=2737536 RepID=UPI0039E43726